MFKKKRNELNFIYFFYKNGSLYRNCSMIKIIIRNFISLGAPKLTPFFRGIENKIIFTKLNSKGCGERMFKFFNNKVF